MSNRHNSIAQPLVTPRQTRFARLVAEAAVTHWTADIDLTGEKLDIDVHAPTGAEYVSVW